MQEARATQPALINVLTNPLLPEAVMRQYGLARLPTQDELPSNDGEPMETQYHVLQMYLLIETLKLHWQDRKDVFVGGNMFLYFSPLQARAEDFRGPDFFVVQGVSHRRRKSWVVWEEGGKAPDVVIELLSDTTAHKDRNEKKLVYQDRLRVPEYFLFDPIEGDLEGFRLRGSVYVPIQPDERGRLVSEQCQLALACWAGVFSDEDSLWLRWETLQGVLLPTAEEAAQVAQAAAQVAQAAARKEKAVARKEKAAALSAAQRNLELEAELAQYREKFGALPK
jgi:Uma2 family endonuclease